VVYEAASDYFQLAGGRPPAPLQASQDLLEAAQDDGRYLLGIYLDSELVGVLDFRLAEPGPWDARLGLILLDSVHRGQGLGSWALRIWEEWLRQATPTEAIVLTVAAPGHAAQRFFRHHGYAFTGKATRVLTGDIRTRMLVMSKHLA
jgi:RimJ/RimL family protein N-acetyltransferase